MNILEEQRAGRQEGKRVTLLNTLAPCGRGQGEGSKLLQQTLSRICKFAYCSLTNSTLSQRERVNSKVAFTLTEVFSSHFADRRKIAFTLAEVLITLGIIGVVAAMTLPALIQNYRKTVYVNQLKKSVSILEQGFQMMLADDGVDNLQSTSVFSGTFELGSTAVSTPNSRLLQNMQKYFKFVDLQSIERNELKTLSGNSTNNYAITGSVAPMVKFSDGTLAAFVVLVGSSTMGPSCDYLISSNLVGKCDPSIGNIGIDVNGLKGPNQYGRDIFWFMLTNGGKLVPYGSEKSSIIYSGNTLSNNWKEVSTLCGTVGEPIGNNVTGLGCAGRIIENGWKMDY
ncbi:type II secretion system protein [bacterium]|nr:type II secretion system protein [bacterium]